MAEKEKLIIDKIIYAKYLYQKGVTELSIGTDLSASVAILLFFDAVEMVVLALEDKLGIDDKDIGFKSRIGKIKKKLAPSSFPLERQIDGINSARVNFKHKAQIQNIDNIKTLSDYAFEFMNQVSDELLGLDFQKISMSSLIIDKKKKQFIEDAETYLNEKEYFNSIVNSVKAYSVVPTKGEDNEFNYDNILGGLFLTNSQKWLWNSDKLRQYLGDILAEDIKQSFAELYHFVSVSLSGIDLQKYKRFDSITPSVSMNAKGDFFTNATHSTENNEINSYENAQFCLDFVLDVILKLQRNNEE